jgi:hypothetical protein
MFDLQAHVWFYMKEKHGRILYPWKEILCMKPSVNIGNTVLRANCAQVRSRRQGNYLLQLTFSGQQVMLRNGIQGDLEIGRQFLGPL